MITIYFHCIFKGTIAARKITLQTVRYNHAFNQEMLLSFPSWEPLC
ncbi:hypothetical protein LLB_3835 [Legionella longbeachae D-4968]|nr:hypothetical protein LLB_3835 [Legionella longbeachae D-4968]